MMSGTEDGFVMLFDSSGTLIRSSYLGPFGTAGGSAVSYINLVSVDSSGGAYIAGNYGGTTSFPFLTLPMTPNGYFEGHITSSFTVDQLYPGEPRSVAVRGLNDQLYLAKYNNIFSSSPPFNIYIGGTAASDSNFYINAMTTDASGNLYVTGGIDGNILPASPTSPVQSMNAGNKDAFIAKTDSHGNLLYATYLGGSQNDEGTGIAVDTAGNIFAIGTTYSSDFPSLYPQDTNPAPSPSSSFVVELNPSGSSLIYSAFINNSSGSLLVSDLNVPTRHLYFVGNAASADVPSNVVGSTYGSFGASYEGYFLAQLTEADLEMTKGSLVLGQNSAAPGFEPRTQSSSCAATSATVLPLGCSLIWNPQLTNLGPAGATDPVVTGATPTGVNVTSCTYTSTSGPSGTCLSSNNTISLSPAQIAELIGQLAASNSINFTITATTNDCYSSNNSPNCIPPGSQVNWRTASSATEDPNLSNN